MTAALKQAEASFDALTEEERAEFAKYIVPRISFSQRPKLSHEEAMAVWEEMKQIGAELAEHAKNGPSALEALYEMRDSRDLTLRAFAGDETAKAKLMMRASDSGQASL